MFYFEVVMLQMIIIFLPELIYFSMDFLILISGLKRHISLNSKLVLPVICEHFFKVFARNTIDFRKVIYDRILFKNNFVSKI